MKKIGAAVVALLMLVGMLVSVVFIAGQVVSNNEAADAAKQCGGENPAAGAADSNGKVPKEYQKDVAAAAKTSGLPESVIAAQIETESGWNPKASSGAGARGIAQFMPDTWKAYGHGADPFDAHAGIKAQGEYMGELVKQVGKLKGDKIDLALTAYNWGLGNVMSHGGVPSVSTNAEAGGYAAKIRATAKKYASNGGGSVPEKKDEAESAKVDTSNCNTGSGGVEFAASGSDNYYAKNAPHCTVGSNGEYTGCPSGSLSPMGMYYRECTDFALFRLNEQLNGRKKPPFAITSANFRPDGVNVGDAHTFLDAWKAKKWKYDHTPRKGSLVWYPANSQFAPSSHGHIAVVKQVLPGGKYIEEGYNFGNPPTDHQYYTIQRTNGQAGMFLHLPAKK